MPRKQSPAHKASLYRLVAEEETPLRDYIQKKYLDMVDDDGSPKFVGTQTEVSSREAMKFVP